jgi:hypothetical protein
LYDLWTSAQFASDEASVSARIASPLAHGLAATQNKGATSIAKRKIRNVIADLMDHLGNRLRLS